MSLIKILLVEDDLNFGPVLKNFLELNDMEVTLATDASTGIAEVSQGTFDLCILDVMLPDQEGFVVADKIKKKDINIPVVFLTARGLKEDQIRAFSMGADDYLVKPFDPELLLFKIKAILRRNTHSVRPEVYDFGESSFNPDTRVLKTNDVEQQLSPKEAQLMGLLLENKNQVLPRTEALIKVWKSDDYFAARSMDVYISKLRKYLTHDPNVEIINVHSSGFRLMDRT